MRVNLPSASLVVPPVLSSWQHNLPTGQAEGLKPDLPPWTATDNSATCTMRLSLHRFLTTKPPHRARSSSAPARACSPVAFFEAASLPAVSFRLLSFRSPLRFSFREGSFSSFFRRLCLLPLLRSFSRCRFFDLRRSMQTV